MKRVITSRQLDPVTFSGKPSQLDRFLAVKKQLLLDYPAELISSIVYSLEGTALDWWMVHPFNYEGTTEGVAALETELRNAFRTSGSRFDAVQQLQTIKATQFSSFASFSTKI
jgi:hypothetical protein